MCQRTDQTSRTDRILCVLRPVAIGTLAAICAAWTSARADAGSTRPTQHCALTESLHCAPVETGTEVAAVPRLNLIGLAMLASGQADEAVMVFERIVRLVPAEAWSWSNLGGAQMHAGSTDAAIVSFTRAVTLRPDIAALWSNLGFARASHGDHAGARSAFARAVAIDPDLTHCWIGLGLLHARFGDLEQAEQAIRSALSRRPGNRAARRALLAIRGEET